MSNLKNKFLLNFCLVGFVSITKAPASHTLHQASIEYIQEIVDQLSEVANRLGIKIKARDAVIENSGDSFAQEILRNAEIAYENCVCGLDVESKAYYDNCRLKAAKHLRIGSTQGLADRTMLDILNGTLAGIKKQVSQMFESGDNV